MLTCSFNFSAHWGQWGTEWDCGKVPYIFVGFQLRIEGYQDGQDDTSTNNIKFKCRSMTYDAISWEHEIEGDGNSWGLWREFKMCPEKHGICGIQVQIEDYQGDGDDTSMNNVRCFCCLLP